MMKCLGLISMGLFAVLGCSHAQPIALQTVSVNIKDKESLQRGARLFMNYCSGCHSLKYLRYQRMAEDLGLTTFDGAVNEELLKNNLIFTQARVYDPIVIALPETDAQQWFGIMPPDLSLSARHRGAAWIYTYLKSFYYDEKRPFKANNLLVPDVAMPNVLAPLVGKVVLIHPHNADDPHLLLVEQGAMFEDEFDAHVRDLVTFLVYVGEPAQLIRYRVGAGVLIFLGILLLFAYRLKKSYWRSVL
jgi:ubiquinol-cytochrome c reductase cytochrome c1 subunit